MSAQLVACNCKCGYDSADTGDSGLWLPPDGGPKDDHDFDEGESDGS